MISALVSAFAAPASASPDGVVHTLAAMVPGAVAGLLADVTLVGPPEAADLASICDYAGCGFLSGADEAELLRRGISAARRDLCLIMQAGYVPGAGFLEELSDLARRGPAGFRAAALRQSPQGAWRLLARGPVRAVVAPKSALLAMQASGFQTLARRLRPERAMRCGVLRVG
ncbi:MAG TPA: hypothetical protein VND97_01645 [Beijerinckiaceae bacterium]|nr:hypothetical protein [Beijerinckiaceae bacterium]